MVMVLPIGIEDDFKVVVDLLTVKHMYGMTWYPENFEISDVPADMVDQVEEYREKLIETAVEQRRRPNGSVPRRRRAIYGRIKAMYP